MHDEIKIFEANFFQFIRYLYMGKINFRNKLQTVYINKILNVT